MFGVTFSIGQKSFVYLVDKSHQCYMNKNYALHSIFYNFILPLQSCKIAQSVKSNRGETSIESDYPLKVSQTMPAQPGRGHQLSLLPISKGPFPLTVSQSQLVILVFRGRERQLGEKSGGPFKPTQARALIKPRPKFRNIWSQKVRVRRDLRGPLTLSFKKNISLRLTSGQQKEVKPPCTDALGSTEPPGETLSLVKRISFLLRPSHPD